MSWYLKYSTTESPSGTLIHHVLLDATSLQEREEAIDQAQIRFEKIKSTNNGKRHIRRTAGPQLVWIEDLKEKSPS